MSRQQEYIRGLNLIKRVETKVGGSTAEGIIENIKRFLGDGRIPKSFAINDKSPKSTIIRELKSLQNKHFEQACYHDGWSWGCRICRHGVCKSNHWDGKEIKRWWRFALGWKYIFYYEETLALLGKWRHCTLSGYHYLLDDDLY